MPPPSPDSPATSCRTGCPSRCCRPGGIYQRPDGGRADQRRIDVAAADVGEAPHMAEHLAEGVGPLPGHGDAQMPPRRCRKSPAARGRRSACNACRPPAGSPPAGSGHTRRSSCRTRACGCWPASGCRVNRCPGGRVMKMPMVTGIALVDQIVEDHGHADSARFADVAWPS